MSELSLWIRPTAFLARNSATPPPGTMPSCTAARVAFSASSTRSFFSLTSTSVAPPTRITATPRAGRLQPAPAPVLLPLAPAPGAAAAADPRAAAGELGEPLLQLLAVVVRG